MVTKVFSDVQHSGNDISPKGICSSKENTKNTSMKTITLVDKENWDSSKHDNGGITVLEGNFVSRPEVGNLGFNVQIDGTIDNGNKNNNTSGTGRGNTENGKASVYIYNIPNSLGSKSQFSAVIKSRANSGIVGEIPKTASKIYFNSFGSRESPNQSSTGTNFGFQPREILNQDSSRNTLKSSENSLLTDIGMDKGEKNHTCKRCGLNFISRESLSSHMNYYKRKKFTCTICEEELRTKKSFDRHMAMHKSYQCSVCFEKSYTEKDFANHMKTHDIIIELMEQPPFSKDKVEKPELQKHQCAICDMVLDTRENLNSHAKDHMDKKKYSCSSCLQKFNSLEELAEHAKADEIASSNISNSESSPSNNHNIGCKKKAPFQCPKCPKVFAHTQSLREHQISHTGQKYQCDICQEFLASKRCLVRHVRLHSKRSRNGSWGFSEAKFTQRDLDIKLRQLGREENHDNK